jgi:tRNA1Val (adenine37-N6)-methyltransferase
MPNAYFRFKRFTIHQDRCSMKVCTDSCILGAWSALETGESKRILDIGTGTALLALMLAQKSPAQVDAIEWDPESSEQARENIQNSPWSERITLIQADARTFESADPYDFIISNPPFFESDLRSPDPKKNKAKHDDSLRLEELLEIIAKTLTPPGAFSILLPFQRTEYFENLARDKGFFPKKKLYVRQSPKHPFFRSLILFSSEKRIDVEPGRLNIRDESGENSQDFRELMKDYYGKEG